MNTKFFVNGRWYKTPCKTVLNADVFTVNFYNGVHTIIANVSDKCYFDSIDNITLSDIKRDFYFSRKYTKPKEFLSKLYETFVSFLNTSISDKKFPLCKNTDEVLDRILEIVTATDSETTEAETAEAEETTDPEVGKFVYDVRIHNNYGWDTYTVRADGLESAEYKAVRRMELETDEEEYSSIDVIRIYKEDSNELLKEIISKEREDPETADQGETAEKNVFEIVDENDYAKLEKELIEPVDTHIDDIKKFKEKAVLKSSYVEVTEPLTAYQFERLTRTLYKSLFKAIGIEETRKIPFIISNNMVFFNYNGMQYKYYPTQCKIFKKCGRKYQRINWKDFADDNSPNNQKQALGRSPPFTPDIRSTKKWLMINKKE